MIYKYNVADQLKGEGNSLFQQRNLSLAIEKYMKALENLTGNTNPGTPALVTACRLNASMCHLELNQFDAAIPLCTVVIDTQLSTRTEFSNLIERKKILILHFGDQMGTNKCAFADCSMMEFFLPQISRNHNTKLQQKRRAFA